MSWVFLFGFFSERFFSLGGFFPLFFSPGGCGRHPSKLSVCAPSSFGVFKYSVECCSCIVSF